MARDASSSYPFRSRRKSDLFVGFKQGFIPLELVLAAFHLDLR